MRQMPEDEFDENDYRSEEARKHSCETCGGNGSCEYEGKFYCWGHIRLAVTGEYHWLK